MREKLKSILEKGLLELKDIDDLKRLDDFRVKILGRNGELTKLLREMGSLDPEERPIMGKLSNETREKLESKISEIKDRLETRLKAEQLAKETIDISMKTYKLKLGHRHPLSQTMEELEDLFTNMGFSVILGPEIDTVYYNFDALNSPEDHPSRDLTDTFYFNDEIVLRTHTSATQVRAMTEYGVPLKMISTGRTFRFDDVDDTHSPMFHQLEGLVVDKDVNMGNLIDTLNVFIRELFGDDIKTRFRPHYFPFTEPSLEVDISCLSCRGEGCEVCDYTGWDMELLGCGMIHPEVLKVSGVDPDEYSGFAFGMGLDRITMVKYGIPNIRLLFENDARFLEQF